MTGFAFVRVQRCFLDAYKQNNTRRFSKKYLVIKTDFSKQMANIFLKNLYINNGK